MEGYLGETKIDVKKHKKYSRFKTKDWVMLFIERYGQIEGSHHKAWVLDQVAKILNGTPVEVFVAKWENGFEEYRFSVKKLTSKKYKKWRKKMLGKMDENGEYEYSYDEGIAP